MIDVGKNQAPGFFKYDLDVPLPEQKKHLTLSIFGIFAAPPAPSGIAEAASGHPESRDAETAGFNLH
ncbi:MAG: hypothetical protein U1F23_04875 [Lysobacterales bacterium]